MFVALLMVPLVAGMFLGVVLKLSELVGIEGYYWLTPPHLVLAKRQQASEYSRLFQTRRW